jgi:hypothetical protein
MTAKRKETVCLDESFGIFLLRLFSAGSTGWTVLPGPEQGVILPPVFTPQRTQQPLVHGTKKRSHYSMSIIDTSAMYFTALSTPRTKPKCPTLQPSRT